MTPRVIHLAQGPARLRPATDRLTAVTSAFVDPSRLPATPGGAAVVHAHEGTQWAGERLAARLGVPLVVTVDGPDAVPPASARLVLAPDDETGERLATVGVPRERLRTAPSDRTGITADLEDWYRDLATDRPLSAQTVSDPAPSVTVVMSTFDRGRLLQAALDALAGQTYPAERFDVVVVDNGSTDDTADVLARAGSALGDRLTVLRNRTNTSAAEARNRALAHATGDIVAFTDDDCRPTPTWLATLVGTFRDDVTIVQGRTRPDPSQPLGPTARSQWTSREHGLYETCNLAYRRSALEALGADPFATDLPDTMQRFLGPRVGAMAFGEDVDLGWRVKRAGGRSRFAADAVVHHHVFTADIGYLLRRSTQVAGFPVLVQRYPELREQFLYRRWFLSRRHLLFLVGLAGSVTGSGPVRAAAWGAYAADLVRPHHPGRRRRAASAPLRAVRDLVETAALVYGSARTRTPVL